MGQYIMSMNHNSGLLTSELSALASISVLLCNSLTVGNILTKLYGDVYIVKGMYYDYKNGTLVYLVYELSPLFDFGISQLLSCFILVKLIFGILIVFDVLDVLITLQSLITELFPLFFCLSILLLTILFIL